MAVITVAVRIGTLVVPAGRGLDPDDLRTRIEAELRELLADEPLRRPLPDGTAIAVAGGRIAAPSVASASSVAHAIARRLHAELCEQEGRR